MNGSVNKPPPLSPRRFWLAGSLLLVSVICGVGLFLMGGSLIGFLLILLAQAVIAWQIWRNRLEQYH